MDKMNCLSASRSFKALILTAIDCEYDAVRKRIEEEQRVNTKDGTVYRVGKLVNAALPSSDGKDWIVAIHKTGAGQVQASLETEKVSSHFNPDITVFVGVAGGRPGKVTVGDIVVPNWVGYFESGKVTNKGWVGRPEKQYPARPLLQAATYEAGETRWLDRLEGNKPNDRVPVHISPIASGEKVITDSDSNEWKRIVETFDQIVAVEMEGHGFLLSETSRLNPAISVRGISDLLDNKNTGGDAADNQRQHAAADRAAAFCAELIANLDTAWLDGEQNQDFVVVELKLEAPKERLSELKSLMSQVWSDPDFIVLESKLGSLIITGQTQPISGEIGLATWDAGLLSKILGFDVVYFQLFGSRNVDPSLMGLVTAIRNLGSKSSIQVFGAVDRLRHLREILPGFEKSINPILKAFADCQRSPAFASATCEWLNAVDPNFNAWVKIWVRIFESRPDSDEIHDTGLRWLEKFSRNRSSWVKVWTRLFDQRKHDQKLFDLGKMWLVKNPGFHSPGVKVWVRMFKRASKDGELIKIAKNRLADLDFNPLSWARVWVPLYLANGPRDEQLSRLAKSWLAHNEDQFSHNRSYRPAEQRVRHLLNKTSSFQDSELPLNP